MTNHADDWHAYEARKRAALLLGEGYQRLGFENEDGPPNTRKKTSGMRLGDFRNSKPELAGAKRVCVSNGLRADAVLNIASSSEDP